MPSAFVTGATGFVGSHLVDRLLERGFRVTVSLRRTSSVRWLEGKAVERVEVDLEKNVSLPPCDIFFHVAGVIRAGSYGEYLVSNRDAAIHAIEGCRARRFVLVSSLAVAGPGEGVDESTPCKPISLYGKSKWEGEQEIWKRRGRVGVTVIRPPVVYGPRDFGLYDMYRAIARGFRPEIGGPKTISLIHARDLAEGIVRAGEAPEGENEVFYLANPETWAIGDLTALIQRALGRSALRVPIPDRVVRFLGAVVEDVGKLVGKRTMFCRDKALEMTQKAWCCRAGKAQARLGWEPRVPVERGMSEALEWYKAQRLL